MNLFQALNFDLPLCTAFVGAGGKTTAMFSLARHAPGPVWVTTSAHLGTDQTHLADCHYIVRSSEDIDPALWMEQKVVLLSGPATSDDRLSSPAPELLESIRQIALREGVSLLLEADGSRSIPLKAPGDHEPPIPEWVRQVVVLAGFSMVGKLLSEKTVYRSGRFSELTGLSEGEPISIKNVRDVLIHPLGGLKNIPAEAVKAVIFNQADTSMEQNLAGSVACDLLESGYARAIIGGLQSAPDELMCYSRY